MYWVLMNEPQKRILVTGNAVEVDELKEAGWDVVYEADSWDEAYEAALELGGEDYLIEWYIEDEVKSYRAARRAAAVNSR
ncbi:MAG: hypothetical protein TU35_009490 [Thermoproteus sp. AZ2]|uniref:Uncharacterized protein n=1 Tax=Thermoproteus sp. AZ2 TaxID=1609232 RepID=A0ACC6V318_9CREN|nr:MAG: hypothetical protein TU35_07085 [Thermoproteus sp. AZ2]